MGHWLECEWPTRSISRHQSLAKKSKRNAENPFVRHLRNTIQHFKLESWYLQGIDKIITKDSCNLSWNRFVECTECCPILPSTSSPIASMMMKVEICSSLSAQLDNVEIWQLCWARQMLDNIPIFLELKLRLFGLVDRHIIVLDYGSVWQKYTGHS